MNKLRRIDFILIALGVLFFVVGGFLLYSPGIKLGKTEVVSPLKPKVAAASISSYKINYQVTGWLYLGASFADYTGGGLSCASALTHKSSGEDPKNLNASLGPYSWQIEGDMGDFTFKETWKIRQVQTASPKDTWSQNAKIVTLTDDSGNNLAHPDGAFTDGFLTEQDTKNWNLCYSDSFVYPGQDTLGTARNAGSYGVQFTKFNNHLGAQPISWIITGTVTP